MKDSPKNLLRTVEELLNEVRHHDLPDAVQDLFSELLAEYEQYTGKNLSE